MLYALIPTPHDYVCSSSEHNLSPLLQFCFYNFEFFALDISARLKNINMKVGHYNVRFIRIFSRDLLTSLRGIHCCCCCCLPSSLRSSLARVLHYYAPLPMLASTLLALPEILKELTSADLFQRTRHMPGPGRRHTL